MGWGGGNKLGPFIMSNAEIPRGAAEEEAQHPEALYCPFCEFSDSDAYFLTQHVELCHPEGGYSPFIVKDDQEPAAIEETSASADAGGDTSDGYAECPHGCGEVVVTTELTNHLDFHVAEEMALGDIGFDFEDDHMDSTNPDDLIEDRFAADISKALRGRDSVPKSNSSANKGKQNASGRIRRLGVRLMNPLEQIYFPLLTLLRSSVRN